MPIRIHWQGAFFDNHSLALVNREIAGRLLSRPDLELTIGAAEAENGFSWDAERVAALRAREADGADADVHVRHEWPMELHRPRSGKWVLMQPWEYGALPRSWYEPMRFGADEVWVYGSHNRACYVESGIPEEKIRVVPLGVHPTLLGTPGAYPLQTRKRFRFLFVGGTLMRKGIDLLLDAYLRSFTRRDDVCLVIKDFGVGTFYENQTYDRFIREVKSDPGKPEIEHITEELTPEQLRDLYHACDCLVHPYRGEGFGLPIAEAMACGLPVIVPDEGGAQDFCTPETAVLLPSRRVAVPHGKRWDTMGTAWWREVATGELADRMRAVHRDPGAFAGLARRGREKVREEFTWERSASAAAEAIVALAGNGTPPLAGDPEAQYEAWTADGARAWEAERPQQALRCFTRALGLRRSIDALYNAGSVMAASGDPRGAIPLLAELSGRLAGEEGAGEEALRAEVEQMLALCRAALAAAAAPRNGSARLRWYAPIFNASGYASESRAFLSGLLEDRSWTVDLVPQDAVKDNGILEARLFERLSGLTGSRSGTPDLEFQHGPASAFTIPLGRASVCRTMLETDRIPGAWAEACNRFTEVWVPTEFNRETFTRSGVLPEKIRIVPGAIEASLHDRARYPGASIAGAKGFRFLSVFDFTPRKGWDILLRAYFEEFGAADDVSLVVKVVNFFDQGITPEEQVQAFAAEHRLRDLPHLILIDRRFTDEELRELYAASDAFVLASRGEGWGRPYMEAMAFGLPTIGTRWSGNLEFMNDENSFLIDVEGLEPCERTWTDMALYRGHQWAVPSVESLRRHLRRVYEDREEAARRGARAREDVLTHYDVPVVARRFRAEMERLLDFPTGDR